MSELIMESTNFKDDINATKKSIAEIEQELQKLTTEELSLRQQLDDHIKENEAIQEEISLRTKEKEELLEKNKILKREWKEITQSLCSEEALCLKKTKKLSSLLGITFNIKVIADLVWQIKISSDADHDNNYLVLQYNKDNEKFELMCMKPTHPNIEQIKEMLNANNDVLGLLCTTRKYFKQCAAKHLCKQIAKTKEDGDKDKKNITRCEK